MHNAMWKLALCVQGVANWSLLETYNAERRAPALRTARQSLENHRNVGRIAAAAYNPSGSDMETSEVIMASHRYGNHLGVEFGTRYESTAVIPDGSEPPGVEDTYSDYAPCATPGCRAPHVWLGNDTEQVSTLDLFGAGFTVLTGPDGDVWHQVACEASRTLHTPVACYTIGAPGLADYRNVFFDQYGITDDGAVLVRPDGYVAWRSTTGNSDGASLFERGRADPRPAALTRPCRRSRAPPGCGGPQRLRRTAPPRGLRARRRRRRSPSTAARSMVAAFRDRPTAQACSTRSPPWTRGVA